MFCDGVEHAKGDVVFIVVEDEGVPVDVSPVVLKCCVSAVDCDVVEESGDCLYMSCRYTLYCLDSKESLPGVFTGDQLHPTRGVAVDCAITRFRKELEHLNSRSLFLTDVIRDLRSAKRSIVA